MFKNVINKICLQILYIQYVCIKILHLIISNGWYAIKLNWPTLFWFIFYHLWIQPFGRTLLTTDLAFPFLLSLLVFLCTHIHTHTYTYTCTHIHIHTHSRTDTNTRTHSHTHNFTHSHTHILTHSHIHKLTFTHTHIHKQTHTYSHTHTLTHTDPHLHTHR